ncbi:MAG TPA: energy transducer TonB [Candidatus Acidoferrum sp.]
MTQRGGAVCWFGFDGRDGIEGVDGDDNMLGVGAAHLSITGARCAPLTGRTPSPLLLVCFSLLALCFALPSQAQDSKSDRKIVTRVEPDYPPVLKMRQIGGTVRLEVTITPKGVVEGAKVLGGNPILAESAVAAVKKWKFVPADTSTTTTVSLDFNPYR